MLSYNDLYEIIRKEKYSEILQPLPKRFLEEMAEYFQDKREQSTKEGDLFVDAITKSKKQLENSVSLFKELILRRKRKLLQLVLVAAETGVMKRDYENMLDIERGVFEQLVKVFESEDKLIAQQMQGKKEILEKYRLILFHQNVDQFIDMSGNTIGPFTSGELAHMDREVAKILVDTGKGTFVDEE